MGSVLSAEPKLMGLCEELCENESIFKPEVYKLQDDKSVPVNADECVGCESCIEVCEQEAITITEIGTAAA